MKDLMLLRRLDCPADGGESWEDLKRKEKYKNFKSSKRCKSDGF